MLVLSAYAGLHQLSSRTTKSNIGLVQHRIGATAANGRVYAPQNCFYLRQLANRRNFRIADREGRNGGCCKSLDGAGHRDPPVWTNTFGYSRFLGTIQVVPRTSNHHVVLAHCVIHQAGS